MASSFCRERPSALATGVTLGVIGPFNGIFIPRGTRYRFEAVSAAPLVLFRVAAIEEGAFRPDFAEAQMASHWAATMQRTRKSATNWSRVCGFRLADVDGSPRLLEYRAGRKSRHVPNAELRPSPAYALESRAHGGTGIAGYRREQLCYPTIEDLRRRARQRVPKFAFDYFDAGSGENLVMRRNREALDDIQFLPRYGLGRPQVSSGVELFGRSYHAPIGISPVGLGGLLWPNMEQYLARSAQRAMAPYILSTAASASIEQIAGIAPDAFWFQIYDLPRDDHRWTFDLIARADKAGAHVLVATIDTPVRAKRPQDMRNRLTVPFRPRLSTVIEVAGHPRWFLELLRRGAPCCENLRPYAGNSTSPKELTRFATNEIKGGFTWEMIQRMRESWPRAFVIKGLLHPADVEKALSLGVDGFIVSNHGGRTFDGVPASIDLLPTIKAVSGNATLVLDSGIRTGLDVVRGIAVGADAVITARPFLYAVAALGANGGDHAFDLLVDETQMAMGQIGVHSLDQLTGAEVIHRGAVKLT